MKPSLVVKLAVSLAVALALFVTLPVGHATSSPAKTAKALQKQAHKTQSALAKYQAGSLLRLTLRDGTQTTGKLGTMSEGSFAFTNSDSNANETHLYSDVTKVEKGKEYIGEGPGHKHIHIF
jgi:hypothetical protein